MVMHHVQNLNAALNWGRARIGELDVLEHGRSQASLYPLLSTSDLAFDLSLSYILYNKIVMEDICSTLSL